MCLRKKDPRGRGVKVERGRLGEKDQAEGQSRYIALHLLLSVSDSSGYKIRGLLSLGEWGWLFV